MRKTGPFLLLVLALALSATAVSASVNPFQIIDSISPSSIITGESGKQITITGRDLLNHDRRVYPVHRADH
jgi:hypothetical protein